MPILQIKILRLCEVKSLARAHMLTNAEQGWKPRSSESQSLLLEPFCFTPPPSQGPRAQDWADDPLYSSGLVSAQVSPLAPQRNS